MSFIMKLIIAVYVCLKQMYYPEWTNISQKTAFISLMMCKIIFSVHYFEADWPLLLKLLRCFAKGGKVKLTIRWKIERREIKQKAFCWWMKQNEGSCWAPWRLGSNYHTRGATGVPWYQRCSRPRKTQTFRFAMKHLLHTWAIFY